MRKIYFILAIIIFSLTSCFEITEDITIHKDGSGQANYIFNFSQSQTKINALLLLETVNGYKVPSRHQINQKISVFMDSLKMQKGITNVKYSYDEKLFILKLSANFDNVNRLNNGVYQFWQKFDKTNAKKERYYNYTKKAFYHQPGNLFHQLYLKLKQADKDVLDGATYTILFRFDQKVVSQTQPEGKISKQGNIVFLKLPLQSIVNQPFLFKNYIVLQP